MKSLKCILLVIVLGLFLSAIGCATLEKGSGERVRLKEPRIKPLAESEWTEEQQQMLKRRRSPDGGGQVANIYTTLANHPKMAEKWIDGFPTYVFRESTLPARDREILMLRIGWLCWCEYEFGAHTRIAKSVGLTDEEIKRITEGPKAAGWDLFDATLLQAVDELHADAFITDATWNALAKRYNKQQLMDVVATVGQYNMVSMFLNSLGVQLDAGMPGFPKAKDK
jgi:alkylhydroperoxidase family enzyme